MKKIQIQLLSDSTFGRGDGVPGLVDDEIDYDLETGLPYIKGRTIKGLIVEECASLLYSASQWVSAQVFDVLKESAERMFGSPGSTRCDEGSVHFGNGCLHDEIISTITQTLNSNSSLTRDEVLDALTGVRRRSAISEETEAPREETLRSCRVLMRGTTFYVSLVEMQQLIQQDTHLLAACVAGLRRAGKNRNRGPGRLACRLLDDQGNDQTANWSNAFLNSIPQGANL